MSSESTPSTPSTMTSATSISNDQGDEFPSLSDSAAAPTVSKNTRTSREETPSMKKKWVPIPAAEMQAALDQARPPRSHSHSHSRTSSRRNSPGELWRGKRLPEESYRRKSGLNTPTSKPPTPPPIKRKTPGASAPVTAVRPLPISSSTRFGTIDRACSPPPDSDPRLHIDLHPKQPGRFGVSIGVPLAERMARRQAASRSTESPHDIEEDWTGDGRWVFGLIGTFDRRTPLPRIPQQQHIHSPRARGARGRGMRGFRGRGYAYRGSPAEPDFAVLAPPVDPYNPYGYGWGYMPVPMWMPYAPPPPPPAIPPTGAPLPMPITQLPYPLDGPRYYVLGQVEYYFSIQNMCQDLYLRQQMDAQGWIPISTISSFNRLRKLTTDLALVRETIQLSSIVELSSDGEKARMAYGAWAQFVLPGAQEGEPSALGLVGVEREE